jgi:hypothetical protein
VAFSGVAGPLLFGLDAIKLSSESTQSAVVLFIDSIWPVFKVISANCDHQKCRGNDQKSNHQVFALKYSFCKKIAHRKEQKYHAGTPRYYRQDQLRFCRASHPIIGRNYHFIFWFKEPGWKKSFPLLF